MSDHWLDYFKIRLGRLHLNGEIYSGVRVVPSIPARDTGQIKAQFEFKFSGGSIPSPGEATFEFDSSIDAENGWLRERIRLTNVQANSTPYSFRNRDGGEAAAIATVGTLEICKVIEPQRARRQKAKVSLVLTPNKVIQTLRPAEFGFHFSSDQRKGKKAIVDISPMGPVSFDIHYDWSEYEAERLIQSRYCLIARFSGYMNVLNSAEKIEAFTPEIDDFLLLCGFATRIPTRCVGWIVEHGRSKADYYRRTQWLPVSESRQPKRGNDGLIPIKLLPTFLKQATLTFQTSKLRGDIRLAFQAVNNSGEETLERKFLSLFAALEGLVSSLSNRPSKQKRAANKKERGDARKKLMSVLDELSATEVVSDQSYDLFAKAISGVEGGISFAEKIAVLDDNFHLRCNDLWPLVGSNQIFSLYQIRNKLAHGGGFKKYQLDSIMVACRHIECTLERLLCAVLGWSLDDTDIQIGQLAEHWLEDKTNWKAAAAALS